MGIASEFNAKKGSIPYSSKQKIRPIQREQFTEERYTNEAFAKSQDTKLLKGPEAPGNRTFASKSAGKKIAPSVGGGDVYGGSGGAPHNPEDLGTT